MCGPPDAPLASLAWKWLAAPGPGCGSQPMVCRRWPGGATLAGELSAAVAPSGAVLSWQANAVAVNAAHARAGAAAAAVSARMRATAAALGQAARRYAGQDTAAAAALGAVRPWGTH